MSASDTPQIDDLRFEITDQDGNTATCEALFMFDSPFFSKSYVVYTDGGVSEEGYTNVFASAYDKETLVVPADGGLASIDLSPITDDEEWAIIQQQLENYQRAIAGIGPDGSEGAEDDPIPLITELAAGAELAESFDYHFENGEVVTFGMQRNPSPANELDQVSFTLPASEHERLIRLFFEEQFGGWDPDDPAQVQTRQVLDAMVIGKSEDGNICTLEPQQCHVFYRHRNDALEE